MNRAIERRRNPVGLDALSRCCLVQEVDRGVRKGSILQVAFGELCGRHHGPLADLHLVVDLVLHGDGAQDLQGGLERSGFDRERSELAKERGVSIGQLARPVDRRRSEQAHVPAREHGLEQVGDAAADRSLPDEGVDVAHVEQRLFRRAFEPRKNLTQPLFDFASKLRAGDEQARLELEQAELGEARRGVAGRQAHGERADDRGLARPGLADQERMVLVPALENLEQTTDLDVTTDDGVEATLARAVDQVMREARESVAAGFGARRRGLARGVLERGHMGPQAARTETEGLKRDRGGPPNLLREGVEQVFDVDGFAPGFALCARQQCEHGAREVGEPPRGRADASQPGFDLELEVSRVDPCAPKDLARGSTLLDRARQQMDGLDLGVLAVVGQALSARHERFGLRGVPLEVDGLLGGHAMARL